MDAPRPAPVDAAPLDYEHLFDDAPCGYVVVADDGRIVRANQRFAAWLGMRRDALVGRRLVDLLTVPARIYHETHVSPLLRMQGAVEEVALELVAADGRSIPVFVNGVDRRGEGESAAPIRLAFFKASERRRYESELIAVRDSQRALGVAQHALIEQAAADKLALEAVLRQSQKMEVVGQLTAGLAHDFNNILVSVSGALEMMDRRIGQGRGDEAAKYVAIGRESMQRAIALTARLLAFSRKQDAALVRVDVNTVVSGMHEWIRHTVGSGVAVHVQTERDAAIATVDVNQLESALLNLAVNARDAMPDGGSLTIAPVVENVTTDEAGALGVAPGRYVVLRVTDTGTGMSPEVASRVLEPFFTTKPVGKGTGLGLAMMSEFGRQSRGGLGIDSRLGAGTTVALYLPWTAAGD